MSHVLRRPRRLRASPAIRDLVRETALQADDFILPLFVSEKVSVKTLVASMPGVFQLPLGELVAEAADAAEQGVRAVLLFGIPAKKDARASQAYAKNGIVQRAVRELKKQLPELVGKRCRGLTGGLSFGCVRSFLVEGSNRRLRPAFLTLKKTFLRLKIAVSAPSLPWMVSMAKCL